MFIQTFLIIACAIKQSNSPKEMPQGLRTLSVVQETQVQVPASKTGSSQKPVTPTAGNLIPSSGFLGNYTHRAYSYTQTYKWTQK